jgi:hypothetical protein
VALAVAFGGDLVAQEPPKPDTWIGTVAAIDAAQRRLTVKADSGAALWVEVAEKARLLRAKPGAKNLADATPLAFESLAVGDRVLLRGTLSDDKASLTARQVVVMSRDDIAQRQEAERADWARRGILGVVTAVDAGGEITLQLRRFAATATIVLPTAGRKITFKRYAPDSVRFSDARPSSVAEIQAGDQLRALGERSADGGPFEAEQIVFGSFQTAAGQVQSVDASKGELTLRDDQTEKKVTVVVGPDARLRRLPPEFAARLAARTQGNGGAGGQPGAERAEGQPAPGAPGESGGRRQWRGAGGGGGEDVLERFPPTTLAEVKVGDRVLVSSTKGADPSRLNAIALVSGLDALRPAGTGSRPGRGADVGLPADLMEMGLGMGAP